MNIEKLKTQSIYSANIKVNGEYETLDIIQEENSFENRQAIKVKFFEERWRTPEDTIELLEKVKIVIEKFIN